MTQETVEKKSNNGLMIGGGIVLLLLLAAAFMGGQMLAPKGETAVSPQNPTQANEIADLTSPDGGQTFSAPKPQAAAGLPSTPPETTGLFLERTDDTLRVGTGSVTAMISTDPDAVPEFSYDGIAMDILVTNQTQLYEDVTEYTFGQTAVQQELIQLENLNDLQENTILQVWGQRDGDRIIADVIIIG
jgi:hypothetical protein